MNDEIKKGAWKKSGPSLFSRDETTFVFQALFSHRVFEYVFRDIETFWWFQKERYVVGDSCGEDQANTPF